MVFLAPILYIGWKLVKKSKFVKPADMDLVWQRPVIDAYEDSFSTPPTGFWRELWQLMTFKLGKNEDMRSNSV